MDKDEPIEYSKKKRERHDYVEAVCRENVYFVQWVVAILSFCVYAAQAYAPMSLP